MEILEAHDDSAFADLRRDWDDLLGRSSSASIYQTWEWNEAWWRAFGRGKRLKLVQVRDGGALVALAPLYVSRHLGTPLRRLAFVGTGAADYLDVLTDDRHTRTATAAILKHLDPSRAYDMADLQQLSPGSALLTSALAWPHAAAVRSCAVVSQEPCPYVRLPESWAAFGTVIGKKMRSNLAYSARLIERSFTSVEVCLADAETVSESMSSLFHLHQRRWNSRLLPGALSAPRVQAFHRAVARHFLDRGWLRLHLIRADGRTVAALYCFQFRGRYYYYLGGFDPDLARFSLGTLLTARAIEQAIVEGCTEFDFLRGDEPYKARWMPERRTNHRVLLSRPRCLRSHAMLHLNRLERYVERRAKEFSHGRARSRRS